MAIFTRESKVKITELRLGANLVANYASLLQTIDDSSGSEVVIDESAMILWGKTKACLEAEADSKIAAGQRLISAKEAEIAEAEALKAALNQE